MQGYNKTIFTEKQARFDAFLVKERIKALDLKPIYHKQNGQMIVTYVDDQKRTYFYQTVAWRLS